MGLLGYNISFDFLTKITFSYTSLTYRNIIENSPHERGSESEHRPLAKWVSQTRASILKGGKYS